MSAHAAEAPTDAFPPARHAARPLVPRLIRTLAVPIILGWIAIIAVVNIIVPQLETVGQMRAVSMSPNDAPSMISMKKVGELFEEGDSDSSVMIVLEGQEALGDETHAFYDEMIEKLEADNAHVQSVQDFWGDPLTATGAQSNDGKVGVRAGQARRQPGRGAGQRVGRVRAEDRRRTAAAAGRHGICDRARRRWLPTSTSRATAACS